MSPHAGWDCIFIFRCARRRAWGFSRSLHLSSRGRSRSIGYGLIVSGHMVCEYFASGPGCQDPFFQDRKKSHRRGRFLRYDCRDSTSPTFLYSGSSFPFRPAGRFRTITSPVPARIPESEPRTSRRSLRPLTGRLGRRASRWSLQPWSQIRGCMA